MSPAFQARANALTTAARGRASRWRGDGHRPSRVRWRTGSAQVTVSGTPLVATARVPPIRVHVNATTCTGRPAGSANPPSSV